MKTKTIFLTLILCCFSVFAMFGLVGCGETSLATVKDNFKKLDETYASYSEVFVHGNCDGLQTDYLVASYGDKVDDNIARGAEEYVELLTLYNCTLAISSAYIDNNRVILEEKELKQESQNALTDLNGSLVEYTNTIAKFVDAREKLIDHFKNFGGQDEQGDYASLLNFKKVYGELVEKNVNLSIKTAKFVEATEIFELLKKTTPTAKDTETVKEYIRAKMLPIYSTFKITEIANKMNWNGQKEGDFKQNVEGLIAEVDQSFEIFKENFVSRTTNKILTTDQINNLFDLADDFFVWSESYFEALSGLNLSKLALSYDNNFENYQKDNKMAKVYFDHIKQFVNVSMDNFMTQVCVIIY